MTPQDFIISKINELVELFPTTKCRYEHHFISDSHFIEVVPNEIYRLSADYLKWEEETTFDFIDKFPNQNLCFISDDALVGIDVVHYEITGKLYNLPVSFMPLGFSLESVFSFHNPITAVIQSGFITTNVASVETGISFSKIQYSKSNAAVSPIISAINRNSDKTIKIEGETTFALAA
jgi:hypothetical protein